MNKMTATYIKDVSENFMGEAALFHLDPPLQECEWVISSAVAYAVANTYLSETLVFPATPDGEILDWMDLAMTKRADVEAPLIAEGYTIVRP